MKMALICIKKKLCVELTFIWKVSYLDSLETEGQENSEMAYCYAMQVKTWFILTSMVEQRINSEV